MRVQTSRRARYSEATEEGKCESIQIVKRKENMQVRQIKSRRDRESTNVCVR